MSVALTSLATRALEPVLAVVFPSCCASCAHELDRPLGGPLCAACWESLPRHRGAQCSCGFVLPEGVEGSCGRCRRGLSPFARGASLGPYEGSLGVLVRELKFRGRRRVARRLGALLLEAEPVRELLEGDVLLVPVPLHPRRLRERGFNQSELVAAAVGRRLRIPVAGKVLARSRCTRPQTGLSAAQRRRNVSGAFVARRPDEVRGRTVVLIDDVLTTGATARACARALRRAGARDVRVLTVARVP